MCMYPESSHSYYKTDLEIGQKNNRKSTPGTHRFSHLLECIVRLVGGYYEIATNQADREEPLEFDYNKMLTGADPARAKRKDFFFHDNTKWDFNYKKEENTIYYI